MYTHYAHFPLNEQLQVKHLLFQCLISSYLLAIPINIYFSFK